MLIKLQFLNSNVIGFIFVEWKCNWCIMDEQKYEILVHIVRIFFVITVQYRYLQRKRADMLIVSFRTSLWRSLKHKTIVQEIIILKNHYGYFKTKF